MFFLFAGIVFINFENLASVFVQNLATPWKICLNISPRTDDGSNVRTRVKGTTSIVSRVIPRKSFNVQRSENAVRRHPNQPRAESIAALFLDVHIIWH